MVVGLLPVLGCDVLGIKRDTSSSWSPEPASVERPDIVEFAGHPRILCELSKALTLLVIAGAGRLPLALLKSGIVGLGCCFAA